MKLSLLIELSLTDKEHQSHILSQLLPATQKLQEAINPYVKATLTNISIHSSEESQHSNIIIDKLHINYHEQSVKINSNEIILTPIEFKLIYTLASRKGLVQSRETLFKDVWKINPDNNTRTLDVHIKKLRDKLGNNIIQTVPGVGYVIR